MSHYKKAEEKHAGGPGGPEPHVSMQHAYMCGAGHVLCVLILVTLGYSGGGLGLRDSSICDYCYEKELAHIIVVML